MNNTGFLTRVAALTLVLIIALINIVARVISAKFSVKQ